MLSVVIFWRWSFHFCFFIFSFILPFHQLVRFFNLRFLHNRFHLPYLTLYIWIFLTFLLLYIRCCSSHIFIFSSVCFLNVQLIIFLLIYAILMLIIFFTFLFLCVYFSFPSAPMVNICICSSSYVNVLDICFISFIYTYVVNNWFFVLIFHFSCLAIYFLILVKCVPNYQFI